MSKYEIPASDTDYLFELAAKVLRLEFSYSEAEAAGLVADYQRNFRNPERTMDDGGHYHADVFIHHEGAATLAWMIHYFCGLEESARMHDFILWRGRYYKEKYGPSYGKRPQ